MRSLRRKGLPDGLALQRGEHVLARAATRAGSAVVATTGALLIPDGDEYLRIPWERVDQAIWRDGRLHVRRTGTGEDLHISLAEPHSVPEVVRDRVTATVVASTRIPLPGGGVRIVGRRPLGGPGDLRWALIFDPGTDPEDPGIRAMAEEGLAEFRSRTGL